MKASQAIQDLARESRARFEAWGRSEGMNICHLGYDASRYESATTQGKWRAWQESERALLEHVAALEKDAAEQSVTIFALESMQNKLMLRLDEYHEALSNLRFVVGAMPVDMGADRFSAVMEATRAADLLIQRAPKQREPGVAAIRDGEGAA